MTQDSIYSMHMFKFDTQDPIFRKLRTRGRIQQPDRCEAATGPCPPVPLAAGLSVHSQLACRHTYNTYRRVWPHRSAQMGTLSAPTNANSTNGLILVLSLADCDDGLVLGNMDVYTMCIPLAAELTHSLTSRCLCSWSFQLLGPGPSIPPEAHRPTPVAGADLLTHRLPHKNTRVHTHTYIPLVSRSLHLHATSPA